MIIKVKDLIEQLNRFHSDAEIDVRDPQYNKLKISHVGLEGTTVLITPEYQNPRYKCPDCEKTKQEKLNETEKIVSLLRKEDWEKISNSIRSTIILSVEEQKNNQRHLCIHCVNYYGINKCEKTRLVKNQKVYSCTLFCQRTCSNCGWYNIITKKCNADCGYIMTSPNKHVIPNSCFWKPIKKPKLSNCDNCANQYECEYSEICDYCDREETSKDNKFIPRVCGNCGWHEKQNKPLSLKKCLSGKSGWINTYDHKEASGFCGWKPIVCKRCDGTGKVCKVTGLPENDCDIPLKCTLVSCPTCKPKQERLMMPVRWREHHNYYQLYFYDTDEYTEVIKQIKYEQHINKFSVLIGDRREYFDTLGQAKTAIKKALGIETK
jgi:hypothetical protein